MSHPRVLMAVGGLASFALLASPARAQHAGTNGRETKAKAADERAAKAKDPAPSTEAETLAAAEAAARLRPLTTEEARELARSLGRIVSQSSVGLTQVEHENGMVSMDLDERFEVVSMARRGADGMAATRCVTSVAEAESFLTEDAKTAASGAPRKAAAAPKTAKDRKSTPVDAPATPVLEEK